MSDVRLHPAQVCFVVDDVPRAVAECRSRFGWGPFHEFTAPVAEASYHDWRGPKRTEVALGMAGAVQVELIHVHEGRDTVAAYQSKYGTGFQHLGIRCRHRENAIAALEALGGAVDDRGEYTGIRFAFVDVPTGPGMFELLEPTGTGPPGGEAKVANPPEEAPADAAVVALDRATIVASAFDEALHFYAAAFGWNDVEPQTRTLRHGDAETRLRRARGRAGKLELELVEPRTGGRDPYSLHAVRGEHGLVHAGGVAAGSPPQNPALECAWLEDAEAFSLYDWAGGSGALQLRSQAGLRAAPNLRGSSAGRRPRAGTGR